MAAYLAASVRVVEEPCHRNPVRQRHRQGPLGQIDGQVLAHRPAHHPAGVEIQQDGEVEPTLQGPEVSKISGLHSSRNRKHTIQGVGGNGELMLGRGGGTPLFHSLSPNAVLAHQPGHVMLADLLSPSHERVPDTRTPVGLATLLVDHPDVREERAVGRAPLDLGPHSPGIISGR